MSSRRLDITHVITEIKDLQYDMQQWIRGEIEQDYQVISQRQAKDLTVISTKGEYQSRGDFNSRYKEYYGKFKDAQLNVDILRNKRITDEVIMVVYRQKTLIEGKETIRVTTAIFRFNPTLKNDTEWLHVHVTQV